jgi:hypothetical protein
MRHDWQEVTKLTAGSKIVIERVRIIDKDIALEGEFGLPPLSRLSMEDQVFVTAFVRCHGSIKEMEQLFGISYPTVKNRLNRIAEQLEFVDVNPPSSQSDVIEQLERGELSVEQAVEKLRGSK